jgi:large subunit ribosomal protein L25
MNLELTAQKRDQSGKGAARRIRRESKVPAVLYGPKSEPMPLTVSALQLEKMLRETGGESRLFNLNIEDGEGGAKQVLIREIQVHPVRRRFLHVDFYEVPLDQPIVIEVVVELVGDALGEQKGGEVNQIQRTLSVRCLPNQIPESIPIDITSLDLGQTLHVGELKAPGSYEFMDDPMMGVVGVMAPESTGQPGEEEAE